MDPMALHQAAAELPDEALVDVAIYASTTCRALGIQKTLIFGGLLHVFRAATQNDETRRELFENLIDDLQISRTQAYRSVAVWIHFGPALLAESNLRNFFVSESLKLLSAEEVSDEARNEALATARAGERVTIRVAEALREKHCPQPHAGRSSAEEQNDTPSRESGRRTDLTFLGSVVRIVLKPLSRAENADREAVIRDLQKVIDRLREEMTTAA
jgi:hypothetical protein